MDGVGNNAPDDEGIVLIHANRAVGAIMRNEPCALGRRVCAELFDREFAVDICGYEIAVRSLQRAVDDDEVSAEDSRVLHAVAFDTGVASRFRMTNEFTGDVDALCKRIVIIDEGKKIYDNDIEHLKSYFGSYRTLRIRHADDTWEERVIDESKEDVMEVILRKQKEQKIKDIQLQEISTEEVIKKIYENSAAAKENKEA